MLGRPSHRLKDLENELSRDVIVEKVTHRIHEYLVRSVPCEGEAERVVMSRDLKTAGILARTHGL